MGLLDDYSRQAVGYDTTRGVSEPVVRALLEAVETTPGRRVADVGGGTGNYVARLEVTLPRPALGWIRPVCEPDPTH